MLIAARFGPGIRDGSITVTFRRWKRRQVVAGRPYRTAIGRIGVDAIDEVDESAVTDAEARAAGYSSREDLLADLRGDPTMPLFRVRFHAIAEPDERDELAADASLDEDGLATLAARLDRLDRSNPRGPWTRATLAQIAARPGVRAGDLADEVGVERLRYKTDVRKLKALGLTLSLEVGYRLSPRGEAYLQAREGFMPDR